MSDHQEDETFMGQVIHDRLHGEDLLPGVDFHGHAYRGVPVGGIVLVKLIDEDGDIYWQRYISAGVSMEEAIGALDVHHAQVLTRRISSEAVIWPRPDHDGDDT